MPRAHLLRSGCAATCLYCPGDSLRLLSLRHPRRCCCSPPSPRAVRRRCAHQQVYPAHAHGSGPASCGCSVALVGLHRRHGDRLLARFFCAAPGRHLGGRATRRRRPSNPLQAHGALVCLVRHQRVRILPFLALRPLRLLPRPLTLPPAVVAPAAAPLKIAPAAASCCTPPAAAPAPAPAPAFPSTAVPLLPLLPLTRFLLRLHPRLILPHSVASGKDHVSRDNFPPCFCPQ